MTVDGVTAGDLEDGSVQFGWFYDANRTRGAEPRQVTQRGNRTTFVFPAEETGIDTAPGGPDGNIRVRLFGKNGRGRPVRGTATVERATDTKSQEDNRGRGKKGKPPNR